MAGFDTVLEQVKAGVTIKEVIIDLFKGNRRAFYEAFSREELALIRAERKKYPYHARSGQQPKPSEFKYLLFRMPRSRFEKLEEACKKENTSATKFINGLVAQALEER